MPCTHCYLFCFLFLLATAAECCTAAPGKVLAALPSQTLWYESADTLVRKSSTFLWYPKCESSLKQNSQSAVTDISSHIWKFSFTIKINLMTREWNKYHIFIFFFYILHFTLRLYNHLTMTIQLHKLREGDGKLFFHRLVSSTFLPRISEIKHPDFCNHIPDFSSTFSVMAYSLM